MTPQDQVKPVRTAAEPRTTSERERIRSERQRAIAVLCAYTGRCVADLSANEIENMRTALDAVLRADAEKIRALEADGKQAADCWLIEKERADALEADADRVKEVVQGWRDSVRACDDDVGDVIREMADSIDAALAATQSPRSEAGDVALTDSQGRDLTNAPDEYRREAAGERDR